MENIKVIIVSAVVVAVGLTGFALFGPTPSEKVVREIIKEVAKDPAVGAIPGNEVFADDFTINGLTLVPFRSTLRTSSTSICSFNIVASSTLLHADIKLSTGSSSALFFEIGKARTPEATTTSLIGIAVGANVIGQILASSSAAGLNTTREFGPDDFLVYKYGGAICTDGSTCNSLVGECTALFIQ